VDAAVEVRWAAGGDSVLYGRREYNEPELLHLVITLWDCRSFTEQLVGSNSTKQLLLVVNWRIEIRFLIRPGKQGYY
jgi:hypothetical protein